MGYLKLYARFIMGKRYTAMDVANLIVIYANQIPDRTSKLTPLLLQTILYYVYVECLIHGTKLFDTPIEKRKFGPFIRAVYRNFKAYGIHHIEEPSSEYIFEESTKGIHFEEVPFCPDAIAFSSEIKDAIRKKVNELINFKPLELVERTHSELPWKSQEALILKGDRDLFYSDREILDWWKYNLKNNN